MNTSVFLALGACCGQNASIFFILLLLIIVALVVWLIMWLLFGCCGRTEEDVTADNEVCGKEGTDAAVAKAEAAEAAEAALTNAKAEEAPKEELIAVEAETGDGEDNAEFRALSEDDARNLFATELEAGIVRQDPVYGIIYGSAPEGGVDDLKRIKGVATVLEGKLNDIGVYRFKQVAVWTDVACEEFSKMLTFKDRIYRDNWIAQARDFHEEKYHEEL